MTRHFGTERALVAAAAAVAAHWRAAGVERLVVGLSGGLGAGKTTWVRAMLAGLGYAGRVPSPTYTLVESYALEGLRLVHVDLYRLASADELEYLGLRDSLAEPDVWMLVEWPERAPELAACADLTLRIALEGPAGRRLDLEATTPTGRNCLAAFDHEDSSKRT